jgi:hypothetical protein
VLPCCRASILVNTARPPSCPPAILVNTATSPRRHAAMLPCLCTILALRASQSHFTPPSHNPCTPPLTPSVSSLPHAPAHPDLGDRQRRLMTPTSSRPESLARPRGRRTGRDRARDQTITGWALSPAAPRALPPVPHQPAPLAPASLLRILNEHRRHHGGVCVCVLLVVVVGGGGSGWCGAARGRDW